MKKLLILLLLTGFIDAEAQFHAQRRKNSLLELFSVKKILPDFRSIRSAPVLVMLPSNSIFTATSYWQGASYTRYSENGRFRSTYSFDSQGILRESGASFSLRKNGSLSYWRVQFSPQRNRPLFIYTIH